MNELRIKQEETRMLQISKALRKHFPKASQEYKDKIGVRARINVGAESQEKRHE